MLADYFQKALKYRKEGKNMQKTVELEKEVIELIIKRCKLADIKVEDIDYDAPIFLSEDDEESAKGGLELDSVDALEIVAAVKGAYGVSIDPKKMGVLHSINTLTEYIRQNMTE